MEKTPNTNNLIYISYLFTQRPNFQYTLMDHRKSKRIPEKKIYICCINYSKAFDCVDNNKVGNFLRDGNTRPPYLTHEKPVWGHKATVRIRHETMNWFKIGKGVYQGCILSPCLFNLHTEYIMWDARLMKHKLASRLPGEIKVTSCLQQRRQWHPTPVLLPRKSHGRRSLVGCSLWGHWELDTTEWLHFHFSLSCIREGNGNPLQYSCLENPRDGGAWWAAISGVAQNRTWLKRLSSSSIYAYNTTLVAESEEELKSLLMKIKEESEKFGL